MAVVVKISINNQFPLHLLEIKRVTNTEVTKLNPEQVSTYRVADLVPEAWTPVLIQHRYGDPVEDLVINALTALKENRDH